MPAEAHQGAASDRAQFLKPQFFGKAVLPLMRNGRSVSFVLYRFLSFP
jgi:hypothetical protein